MNLALKEIEKKQVKNKRILVSIEENKNNFAKKVEECLRSYNVSYENPNKFSWDLTAWENTYTISSINDLNKYSSDYYDCTWIICTWISRLTGERISFLSHQDPIQILDFYKKEFVFAFTKRLKEMVQLAYFDSIDIWIFAWTIQNCDIYESNYLEMVKLISQIVKKILAKNVEIIIWPNYPDEKSLKSEASSFYFDNDKNVIFAYKPTQNNSLANISFPSNEIHDTLSFIKWL